MSLEQVIVDNQKALLSRMDAFDARLIEVRDIALKNSHDLNNGIKSQVAEIKAAVVKTEEDLQDHERYIYQRYLEKPEVEEVATHIVTKELDRRRKWLVGLVVAGIAGVDIVVEVLTRIIA